jgi:hypothetical protein
MEPQSKRSEDGRAVFLRKMTRQRTRRARRVDAEHVATFARTSLEGGNPGAEQAGIEGSEIAPAPAGPEGQRRRALATATSRRPVTRQRHPQMLPCRLKFQPRFRSPFRAQGDETSPILGLRAARSRPPRDVLANVATKSASSPALLLLRVLRGLCLVIVSTKTARPFDFVHLRFAPVPLRFDCGSLSISSPV